MMRSPKYRKGKKPAFSAPVAAMFILAAVFGMQYGCTDSSPLTESEQTGIEKDVYGAISGDVHDLYTNAPLKGVKVKLQGVKKQYSASTDSAGKFRINNVWLGSVTGVSGGAGDAGGWGDGSVPQKVEFDFPLYFDTGSYAPWKEQVALSYEYIVDNGTIVIPSGTFFEVGRTGMMPYVQSFSGKVYAGPGRTPARGVTVMLDHLDYPSSRSDWPDCNGNCPDCEDNNCESYEDYVRLVNSFAVTDANGVFTFDLADRVVAYDDYHLIVTPYDVPTEASPPGCAISCEGSEDPDCEECDCFACVGDGIYEYDSMSTDLYLEPKPDSGFDLMGYELDGSGNPIVVQTHEFEVNLRHGSNSLQVNYCSLSNMGGGIIPVDYNDLVINVSFNYPLRGWVFQLLKDQSIPVAIKVQPTSSANISFDITPLERLNVNGNTWRFRIYAVEDYVGNTGLSCDDDGNLGTSGNCYWDFNVAGFVPPVGPIAPRINVNTGSSQTFTSYAPDRGAIYRLYKSFGPTNPNSVMSTMLSGADQPPWLHIAFDKPAQTVGTDMRGNRYYAYLADRVNTAWVEAPVSVTYEDNQSVEGQIYLPSNFDYSVGGDNNFLGDGNVLRMTILPVNEDGLVLSALLEAVPSLSILELSDDWGPMIVGDNRSIFGYTNGTVSANGGTRYDERANIALHEILDASVDPTATESSANFDVEAIFMDEKHTFVTAEFAPTVTATLIAPALRGTNILVVNDVAGFYPGDDLALYLDSTLSIKTEGAGGPGSNLELDGYDDSVAGMNILILNTTLSSDHAAGEVVAMLGPMQQGIEAREWATKLKASTQNTAHYIAVAPDLNGMLPGQMGPSVLIVNETEIVPVTGVGLPTRIASPLLSAYPAGISARSAMAGFGDEDSACGDVCDVDKVARTLLAVDATGGAGSITVEEGKDIQAGDWLQVGSDDYVQVDPAHVEGEGPTVVNFVSGQTLHYSYAARVTAVVELTVVTGLTDELGDGVTMLAYPLIDVLGIDNLLSGKPIRILDPSVPANVYTATVLSTYDAPGDNNWIGLSELAPVVCEGTCRVSDFSDGSDVIALTNTRSEDTIQISVTDTSGNSSSATDKDGDGQADFDELELWSGGLVK